MSAQNFNFTKAGDQGDPCEVSADFAAGLTWQVQDDTGAWLPVDLTGYSAKMQLRSAPGADDLVFELSTTNGRLALGGAAGTIDIHIDGSDTATIPPALYAYDLVLTDGNGYRTRFVYGLFEVIEGVTV